MDHHHHHPTSPIISHRAGLLARSPEGHAARGGLHIKDGGDDSSIWVSIQANTFRNWVNENLPADLKVTDLAQDLCTGVRLCVLVETLQGKGLRGWNRRPVNQHHYLENVACALSSVEGDGVKLVNIGNLDIVNGNLKLILGLIWSLIVRYQIGRSKFPPRKLMLAWLQAVLPECKVNNLTTDWNSGVLLSALVDYCRPGLFPHWRRLDKHNGIDNCRHAMDIAQKQLGIPAVLEPEYLASPWLDELSGMTYLSYFMKPDSPGFHATLRWVNSRLDRSVKNFTSDWNDGKAISEVIRSLGGSATAPEKLRSDPAYWEANLTQAVEAGKRLGVQPILSAKDMADHNVEHLGVMAYTAYFQWIPERPPLHDLINVKLESTSGRVGEQTRYQITLLSDQLSYSKLSSEIRAPDNRYYTAKTLRDGSGTYVPQKVGMHELIVRYEGEEVSTKHYFRALPPLVEVVPPGMAPCALGSIVQVLVNATGAPKREDILVTAFSPNGRPLECPLTTIDGTNTATFKPDEAGIWRIEITYQGKHIQGGPFTCAVFDPNGVVVSGLEGALPMVPHAIDLDCRDVCVPGEVFADVVYDKRSLHTRVERVDIDGYLHRVHFTPVNPGKHRVYVYFNGYDVRHSPFLLRVGTQRRSKHNSAADIQHTTNEAKPGVYTVSPVQESVHHSKHSAASYLASERRASADGPELGSFIPRASSPSLAPRTQSPTFRGQSPNFRPLSPLRPGSPLHHNVMSSSSATSNMKHTSSSSHILRSKSPDYIRAHSPSLITSRLLNNKLSSSPRASPVNMNRDDYNSSSYQMGKMRLANRSPAFQELRSNSPDYGYSSTTRYNKSVTEQRGYNNSFEKLESNYGNGLRYQTDEPIIKFPSSPTPSPIGGRRLESWDVVGRTNQALEQHQQIDQSQQVLRSRDYSYKAGVGMSRVGGATSVKVQDIPDGVVGRPVEFEIDGSGAGSGDLEILVEGGRVTSSVRSLGGQRFRAAFTPHQALPHRVDIRFNGETVPGSPWHTSIMPSSSSASVLGEATRLVPARTVAHFEIVTNTSSSNQTTQATPSDLTVYVIAPSKRAVPAKVTPSVGRAGVQTVEFTPTEVGTHVIEVSVNGEKLASGPLIAKVYDAGLIQVADVSGGVVGQAVQFRVDASQAGEGQLEISINEGEVPNHVQVVGGGRCLVSFTPDVAKPHLIDIKFNGETVNGCPFICTVADTSRVTLSLAHLELIPVNQTSSFHMNVAGGGAAELAVAVRGPVGELPVKVTGDIHSGFTAEFTPSQVGAHQISVDYNNRPVQGTPFISKAFDSTRVTVGQVARGTVGRPVTFSVDASEAGEGNLEITISARGLNIPTQVHPQGNAKFAVSFVPAEACDHVVNVAFNKRPVVGCPLIVGVGGGGQGPSVTLPGPGPVNRASTLLVSHPGRLEDIEVNVEGPGGQAVPTQVQPLGNAQFRAEFVPRVVGEHRISVSVNDVPTAGSPYAAKVYDVQAIRVKEAASGVVGKPVTFLVETSQAGPGNLEVTVNGGRVPTSAQAQGPHTYAISFTPREPTAHSVDLRFNGQDVPGSPFQCAVSAAARVLGVEALDKVAVGRQCGFVVESGGVGGGGGPTVEVLGPARRQVATQVTPQAGNPGKFDISFTPLDVGDHSVEVRLPGGHIDGSPFLIKAYDAQRVSVTDINDGIVGKPVSFSINASQAGAGNLEIIVAVAGRNVPNFVQSEGNARFKVNFKPTEAAVHTLSVRFNGQAVPGSPFSCKVSPGNTQPRIPVSGSGIELAAISHPAEIKIEGVSGVEPQVITTAPNGKILTTKLTSGGPDSYIARFTPEAVGRHSVAILLNDQHVIGSPFNCNVYDVNKVIVSGLPGNAPLPTPSTSTTQAALLLLPPAEVGKPITFSVDAAQAGEGTLELVVSTQHTTIKAEVVACARGLYDVTFVPQTGEDHYVNITFNDANVAGSPFRCGVIESGANASGERYLQVASVVSIDVPSNHRIDIRDGNDKPVKYTMNNNGKAEFNAAQTGTYQMTVTRASDGEVLITRTIHVFDTSKIDVINAPSEAICHRPSVVGVNVSKAGPGVLTARVTCAARDVAHSVRQSSSSTNPHMYDVVFHPTLTAPHRVQLLYNGVPKGEVLELGVRCGAPGAAQEPWAGGLGLYQGRVGRVNVFNIDTLGRPAREFDIIVSTPGGNALPVRCYQTKTGRLQAEFTARDIGEHTVEVLQAAKPLTGSPFVCDVFDVDAVRILDVPHVQGNVGEKIMFNVSTKNAGVALLSTTVTNPIAQPILVTQTPSADDPSVTAVSFTPTAAGLYQATVTYGGVPVKGSPLALGVGPVGPTPPPRAVGKALELGVVGERCGFSVSSPGGQPRVQIEAIEGTVDAQIQSTKPGEWLVTYTPKWVGVYDIIIGIGATDLPGSPFRPTIINPSTVRLIGGWAPHLSDTSTLLLPTKLVFDTTSAGPGQITCTVAGRTVPVEKTNQRWKVDLNGEGLSSGEHELEVKFSGVPLGGETPRKVSVVGGLDEVILTGRGLQQVQCGEVAVVGIDGSKATSGNPEVTLHSADSNLPIPVMISLAGEKNWRASYTINTPGNYLLSVLWNGRPVKGCPLMVEAKGGADASKVLCSGEGLRQGVVGREIRSWIDTRRAGPGELTAHCTGPRKVAYCELYDHGDATFTLNVKPQEPGRHALTIKYAGQHVNGSPFTLRVAGAPDASKVRVYGPGIEHGVLATFQSRFICDTRGAGAGQLTVRVRGPKGAFRVEMQRESQKDRTILNKYDPTEPGDYRVEVKWAGELVPGSPFHVMIFDTQEELRRYINSIN